MKKILPILFGIIFLLVSLIEPFQADASSHIPSPTVSPTPAAAEGRWMGPDSEVTLVGKTGARSDAFLRWTLQNYQWLTLVDGKNPLIPFWITIRNIVYAVIALFVLATAFILIITRGQSITVMRFVPRFVFIVVLITLSFSMVQFIYVINDIVQGFFLRVDNRIISTEDLLFVGFDYETFTGFRRVGVEFEESAFISLLLVRLTAITYYVMTGLLLVRKIILWFFIIISPVFPLLLFYRPIRNTAKIWVGEFFRWLLYAPLFAIFLHGLVVMWRTGIPLPFDFSGVAAGQIVYPTAINILLGGPGQTLSITNSVNLRDTFALYVVALLMLWVVILLPFLLLKIFLDYLSTLSLENNLVLKQFMNRNFSFLNREKGIPPAPGPQPPGMAAPSGVARSLPFIHKAAIAQPIAIRADMQASVQESASVLRLTNLSIPKMRDIARLETSLMSRDATRVSEATQFHSTLLHIANPSIVALPSERERFISVRQKLLEQKQKGNPIASSILNASQISTATTSIQTRQDEAIQSVASSILNASQINTSTTSTQSRQDQVTRISHALTKITNPESVIVPAEKEKFIKIKEQLLREKEKGNTLASSILETSEKITKQELAGDQKSQAEAKILDQLLEKEQKRQRAEAVRAAGRPAALKLTTKESLPAVNRVQQVSLEDYEEVRKMWTENYQTLETPKDLSGREVERREWIKNDIDKINQAIALLSSQDAKSVNQGMEMVANILPFLLIGGFSKSEVVAYLKAKMEAGKQVLSDVQKREEEEESKIGVNESKVQKAKVAEAEARIEKPFDEASLDEARDRQGGKLEDNPAFSEPAPKLPEDGKDKSK